MQDTEFQYPEALVSTEWLASNLSQPNVRLFECTVYLVYEEGAGKPYQMVSGRADYDAAHIPGAVFLDLQRDFSRPDSPFRFTLPTIPEAAAAFGRFGIDDDTKVILYSRKNMQWASRFWWMLRWLGFDNAAILDGGFDKWTTENRRISSEPGHYLATTITPRPRPELFAGREEMLAAVDNGGGCTINALSAELHSGEISRYGRPGRIPGSVNVPAAALLDPKTLEVLPPQSVAAAFDKVGADRDKRILTYCGGGIAATLDAFLLHQLGYRDIAVYDNSMSEWATDTSLPIEVDQE